MTGAPDVFENSAFDGAALLQQLAAERSEATFAALFRYFAPRVKAYLLRIGCSSAEAEELMQETMLGVWQRASTYEVTRSAAITWVYTIARNRRIDALRRKQLWSQQAHVELDLVAPLLPDEQSGIDEQVALYKDSERLQRQLQELPSAQEEVLRLAFLQEKTHQEIAVDLTLPLGTVKSRIRAGLMRLQELF